MAHRWIRRKFKRTVSRQHDEELTSKSKSNPESSILKDKSNPSPDAVLDSQEVIGNKATIQMYRSHIQRDENNSGLPSGLKSGVENLSGHDMSDVSVHYNSPEPDKFGAAAFAEGSNIHVGPGQESHLPHEAWHVVQQKQGRVDNQVQFKGLGINVNSGLESEADSMGAQANQIGETLSRLPTEERAKQSTELLGQKNDSVQRAPVRQFGCKDKGTNDNTIEDVEVEGDVDEVEVIKYANTKNIGNNYRGENLDSSNNPLIVDGREGARKLLQSGMSNESVIQAIKTLLPNFSTDEITRYFINGEMPKVEYVEEEDRDRYQVIPTGNSLKQNDQNFDTGNMFSSGAGAGYSVFVMSPGGEIYSNEHKPGLFHHSSFLAGLPTAAAGELKVTGGRLQHVTNKSGHYHPGAAQMYQFMKELKEKGMKLSKFPLKIEHAPDEHGRSWNQEWASGRRFVTAYERAMNTD